MRLPVLTGRDIRAELSDLQDRRCGICGAPEREGDRLELDHDHDSGMVRGLLCGQCNKQEGRHGCDRPVHECAICSWRVRPAVCWLGWTERHLNLFGHLAWGRYDELARDWQPTREIKTGLTFVQELEQQRRALLEVTRP